MKKWVELWLTIPYRDLTWFNCPKNDGSDFGLVSDSHKAGKLVMYGHIWSYMVIYGHIWSYMVIYILPVSTSLFPKRTLGTNLAHLAVGFLRRVWSTTSSRGILPRGSSTLEKSTGHMGASWFQCMTSGPLYDPGMDVCMYICIYIYIIYYIYIYTSG